MIRRFRSMPLRLQKLSLVLFISLVVITIAVIIGVVVSASLIRRGLGPCVDVRTDTCVGPEITKDVSWCTEPNPNLNDSIVMINLGDFGWAKTYCTDKVSKLIKRIQKRYDFDFIVTMGDNNYYTGNCSDIDANIGQFYSEFFPHSKFCHDPNLNITYEFNTTGGSDIRFFPCPGNHDWDYYFQKGNDKIPYLQYFNYLRQFEPQQTFGSYYRVDPMSVTERKPHLRGMVELFSLNSNLGTAKASNPIKMQEMKEWAQQSMSTSNATHRIAFFHHSPFSTARHDPNAAWMRWDFKAMGASMVLSGHQHTYERFKKGDMYYLVNGLGGNPDIYDLEGRECPVEPDSEVRYNSFHGAALSIIEKDKVTTCMYNINSQIVDKFIAPIV